MGFDKPTLVVIIVLYLFLSSFACAKTFDTVAWNPGLDFDIKTHDVNFTIDINLSDMGISVLEGEWHVEDGNLTSKAPVNWFILTDEIEISKGYPITKEYVVYGMEKLTRFTLFYGSRFTLLGGSFRHSYWEFDIQNNVLNCITDVTSIPTKTTVHYSAAHDLAGVTDFVIKTYIEKPWGLARTHVLTEIHKDGVKIATAEWKEWMASEVLSCTGGVYTEQEDLKVHTIEGMKRVDVDESSAFSSLSLLFKMMLFKPPGYIDENGVFVYIMPLWLNLVMFKVPVFMLGIVILLIIRGTE